MKNKIDTKIQKYLNKLISEELTAGDFYNGCLRACDIDERKLIEATFKEIAEDEVDDHASHMIKYAQNNDFECPVSYKDYEKYAKKCYEQINKLKSGENAAYYIDQALQSEQDAVESYQEIIDDVDVPQELRTTLLKNYYEELEHISKLTTLMYVLNANMVMGEY